MPGVSRSFSGPVRISDLLAIEEAKGTIPTTDELIEISLNWVTPFSLITRPQLLSFIAKELTPALQKAGRSQLFIKYIKDLLEELPEKVYKPISDIATLGSFPKKFAKFFGSQDVERYSRVLRGSKGTAYYPVGQISPFLIGLNPELMDVMTPLHEMFHYWAAPERFSPEIRKLIWRSYRDIPVSQRLYHEGITGATLSSPDEYAAEFIPRFIFSSPVEQGFWARQIGELPPFLRYWIQDIINEVF